MKRKISYLAGFILLFFSVNTLLNAQNHAEIPVLLNTEPVLAVVNDSADVVKVVKPLPGYMEGYQLETQTYSSSEVVVTPTKSSSGYLIISSETFLITFRSGFAVLDDEAVDELDKVISDLKKYPGKSLLLSVFNDFMGTALYKNRINAIKSYVKIEGISLDRIKLNYLEGSSTQDEFKINFVE